MFGRIMFGRAGIFMAAPALAMVGLSGCGAAEEHVAGGASTAGAPVGAGVPASERVEPQSLLSDGTFTDPENRYWTANAEASFQAARVVLRSGGLISQVVPGAVLPGRRFRLRVDTRSLDPAEGLLRLQAVWLPDGGWQATDGEGNLLRVVEASRVRPGTILQPHSIEISKPDMARTLVIYLQNDGDVAVEILQARLTSLGDS